MKASVVHGLGAGFETREVWIDEPLGREVLVDVKASGLCHSDLHLATVDYGYPLPAVFGHEVAGVVAAVGPGVTAMRIGDHVVACLIQFCGACRSCLSGHTYACSTPSPTLRRSDAPARLGFDRGELTQAHGIAGFAQQALIHENQLAVIDQEMPFAPACIIGCGTATGFGAVINAGHVRVGDSVAILGAGGVGLNAVAGARISGALQIIVVDVSAAKLAIAMSLGATHVVNASEVDPVEAVLDITGGGVTHAFEVIGLEQTQRQAVSMARPGGAVFLVGLARPGSRLELPSSLEMLRSHVSVSGVHMGSTNLKRDIPMYVEYYLQGRLDLDSLVSREISLGEIQAGYDGLVAGHEVRVVVTSF